MPPLTLPRDLASLRQGDPSPAAIALAAPEGADEAARQLRAIVSSLSPPVEPDVSPTLSLTEVTTERSDGGVTVRGRAKTSLSTAREASVAIRYDARGALTRFEVTPAVDDGEARVSLGARAPLALRIRRALYAPTPGAGRVLARFTGHVDVGGASVPMGATVTGDGAWTLEAFPSPEAADTALEDAGARRGEASLNLDKLLQLRGEELAPIRSFLKSTLDETGLRVDRFEVGFEAMRGEVTSCRVVVGGASARKPWVLVDGKLAVERAALDLQIDAPTGAGGPLFKATLDGDVQIKGATIQFRLTSEGGRLKLAPRGPVALDVKGLLEWMGASGLAEDIPEWAGPKGDLTIEDLALGLDLNESAAARVSLLQGAVVKRGEIPLPGLEKRAAITELSIGLEVRHPFVAARRKTRLSLGGKARVQTGSTDATQKEFALSGWVSTGSRWELVAEARDALSLTGALDALVGLALDDQATSLFGDFDLSVAATRVTLGPRGRIEVRASALIQKKPGVTERRFDVGVGRLELTPGRINVRRDERRVHLSLRLGMSLAFNSGPAIEECALWVDHDSARKDGRTSVTVSTAVVFPREGEGPVRVDVLGVYTSGAGGGFSFSGRVGELPLNPVINGMLGLLDAQLPADFPTLKALDLGLSFDTATGAYKAEGKATASEFKAGGTVLRDVTFTFDVSSSCKGDKSAGARVYLESSVTIDGTPFSLSVEWSGGRTDIKARASTLELRYLRLAPTKKGVPADMLFLFRTGETIPWLRDAELAWARVAEKDGRIDDFATGVTLRARVDLKPLKIPSQIKVELARGDLAVDVLDANGNAPPDLQPVRWARRELPAAPTADAAPAESAADEGTTVTLDGTLSLATVIDRLAPSSGGGGGWRSYVGNAVVLSNAGVTFRAKPKPNVAIFSDVAVQVGPWFSVAVKTFTVRLTPDGFAPSQLARPRVDFDLDGAAVAVNIPPFVQGAAAVIRDRSEPDAITVVGLGELQLLKKVKVGALVFLRWNREGDGHALKAGFGFVYATGFAVAIPPLPILLTGVAGGFGYNAVPKLPTRAEDVPDNALLRLMRGSETDYSAKGMLDRLDGFKRSVEVQPGAWCVMFGITLTLAKMVDCAVLAVVESRRTGLEVSVLGVADFTLGAKSGSGMLGRIQLGLLVRWSSSAGSVKVLGAVTGESWLLDEKCRLQGGFALCFWYAGPHAGDFLVSIGGYSPFAPVRAHYPALDRVGIRWKVSDALSIYGESYLTLDRYSLQLGCAAGMSFRTAKVKLEAHYSFDAIVEWAPLYYEARLRISVHVEIKVVVTLRLGLDVDVHLWGPPFGARIHVEVELWPFNPSFTVSIGSDYEDAQFERNNVSFNQVVELAAGAKDASTLKFVAGESPAVLVPDSAKVTSSSRSHRFAAERPCAADAASVSLETAIPLTELSYGDAGGRRHTAGGERGLQVRPKRWERATSSLVVMVYELLARKGAEPTRREVPAPWELAPVVSQPLESLWVIPKNRDRPWDVERAELITAVQVTPPSSNAGARFDRVTLAKEMSEADKRVRTVALRTEAAVAAASPAALADALNEDRAPLREALALAGFAVGRCAKKGFRAFEATPMQVRANDWEVRS